MSSTIDQAKVIDAIVACEAGPVAKQDGARLVDTWIQKLPTFGDTKWPSVGVEMPFYIKLDEKTYAVGMMDRLAQSYEYGIVGGEWKSRRAPKLKKDGTPYQGDTENDWLAEISMGPQLAIYGLAMREGVFCSGTDAKTMLNIPEPVLLVRACVKSVPATIWPTDWERGLFRFPKAVLDSTRNAILVKAAQLRAARMTGLVPWQMPGYHCKSWNRVCEYYQDCTGHKFPQASPVAFHETDPGFEAARRLNLDPLDRELIVLSQSGYQLVSQCAEKWRRVYGGHSKEETSIELQTGTAMHAGLAAVYEQLR